MTANKFTIAFMLGAVSLLAACQPNAKTETPNPKEEMSATALFDSAAAYAPTSITIDSANRMINSYIASIGGTANDSNLYSVIVNADSLRAYLNNTSIKHVKIMFAHKLSYVNRGNYGKYAGYNFAALTFVLAGFGANGNYIYTTSGQVMDNMTPCPNQCPTVGSASSNNLAQQ